jgi:lipopolysaccharide/colanic/teichoic acid biosynthesis glycosyltransferase
MGDIATSTGERPRFARARAATALADASAGAPVLTVEAPLNGELVVRGFRPARARRPLSGVLKRTLDIVVSASLLLIALPLLLLVALLVRIDSRGSVLFRCDRAGHHGRRLRMLKFRKMHDKAAGAALTMGDDDRFTRVGRWLARLKLDELPQLWHVLRGDMSLVGPRPESEEFIAHCRPDYAVILQAKPGIIGLSQIAFFDESRILDSADPVVHYLDRIMPQKVRLDLLYVTRKSGALDLRILLWAFVAIVLRRDVAVHRSTGKMSLRRR